MPLFSANRIGFKLCACSAVGFYLPFFRMMCFMAVSRDEFVCSFLWWHVFYRSNITLGQFVPADCTFHFLPMLRKKSRNKMPPSDNCFDGLTFFCFPFIDTNARRNARNFNWSSTSNWTQFITFSMMKLRVFVCVFAYVSVCHRFFFILILIQTQQQNNCNFVVFAIMFTKAI